MGKVWIAACCVICCAGCRAPRGPVSIHSDDADLKIHAIREDVGENNKGDIPVMVADLKSEDPAIRFYSIEALRRLTNDDFGYRYYESDEERAPATLLWEKWLTQQSK